MKKNTIALYLVLTWSLAAHSLATLAQDARGASTSGVSQDQPTGKVYALIVGVSDYKSEQIPDLKFAAGDARAVAEYLLSAPLQIGQILEFYDKDATFANINEKGLNYLDELVIRKEIKPEDIILLYFAGHGGAFNELNSYFFPHDALHMTDGESSLRIKRIKNKLQDWVEERNLKAFFILDACRSATIGMKEEGLMLVSKYLEAKTGEILMAATSGGQPAMEYGELNHGVFTFYLLEGLYGKADTNANGFITASELGRYISNHVAEKTGDKQVPIFDYSKYQTTNLFKVDKNLLAKADANLKVDLNSATTTMLAARGGNFKKTSYSVEVTDLMAKFESALQKKQIVRPESDCALLYFNQLQTQTVDQITKSKYKSDISVALFDAAKQTLENDLHGLRNYMQQSIVANADKGKGESTTYDLHYYDDAVRSLELFINISANSKEDKMGSLLNYLKGRNNFIRYSDEEDAVKSNKFLKESEKNFKDGLKISPDEPYLLMGYAFVVLDLGKEEESIKLAKKAAKLAPLWSWPLNFIGSVYRSAKNDSSMYFLDKAVSINPKDFLPWNNLGNLYYDTKEYEKAVLNYQKSIDQFSNYKYSHYNMGYALYFLHKHEEAIVQFKKTLEIDPNYAIAYNAIGNSLDNLKRPDEAIVAFQKAIEIDPKYVYAHHNLGYQYGHKGRKEEAIAEYRKIIEIDPTYVNAYFNMGYELDLLGRKEEAKTIYYKAIEVDPAYTDAYHNLGILMSELGDKEEALRLYSKAVELDPNYIASYHGLGNVLSDLGRRDESIKMYIKAIEIDPKYVAAYLGIGNVLSDQGKNEEAIVQYKKCIEIDPKYISGYIGLGHVLHHSEKREEALKVYHQVLEIDPKYAAAYHGLGVVLAELGRKEEALVQYHKAIESDPKYVSSYLGLGNVLCELDRKEEGMKYYRLAIEVDPTYVNSYFNMGYELDALNRKEEAAEFYKKAIEVKPTYTDAYNNLGKILKELGRTEEAIKVYMKAVEIDPAYSSSIYFRLAYALNELGRNDEALVYYRKAMELDPKDVATLNNLASILSDQSKNDEAIDLYKKALEIDPAYVYARHGLAYVYNTTGRKEEAIAEYNKLIETDPKYVDAYANVASILEELGKHDEAIKRYKEALAVDPNVIRAYGGLGYVYTGLKRYDEALPLFTKAISIQPDNSTMYYNMACYYAIVNDKTKSVEWLKKAFDKGYDSYDWMMSDKDLTDVRETIDFKILVAQYFKDGKKR